MSRVKHFLRDPQGAIAAEFALIVPVLLVFLLGIIDVGYYAWSINRGEKATQMGARFAVVTDMVAADLADYSFATSGGIAQGTTVPDTAFPGVTCTSTTCTCKTGQGGSCDFGLSHDSAAFTRIVDRMRLFERSIAAENVQIDYDWSGLGFSGDPNGPDVAPIVTVSLINMTHRPVTGFVIGSVDLPNFAYSLTAEDSSGQQSN